MTDRSSSICVIAFVNLVCKIFGVSTKLNNGIMLKFSSFANYVNRNKMKEVARCVEKQVSWCAQGDLLGKLDSLQLPNFNSRVS